jgi:hypothetical protein
MIRITQELRTAQWYTDEELKDFYNQFIEVTTDLIWLHKQIGEDNIPGNGLNIPKYHDWLNCVRSLEEFGSSRNVNTSPYERLMKSTKELDRRTKRSRGDNHAVDLFQKTVVVEINRGMRLMPQSPKLRNFTSKHLGESFSLTSKCWFELKTNLFSSSQQERTCNMKGPPLDPKYIQQCDDLLKSLFRKLQEGSLCLLFFKMLLKEF